MSNASAWGRSSIASVTARTAVVPSTPSSAAIRSASSIGSSSTAADPESVCHRTATPKFAEGTSSPRPVRGKIMSVNTRRHRRDRVRNAVLAVAVLVIVTLLIWYMLFSHPAGGR